MATIASLIVRIGADKSQLDSVLAKAGESAQNLDATLKKLGNTPIGQEATKSAQQLSDTLKQVTDRQQTIADRAKLAAQGLESLGGPARLTKDQLDQLNKTIEKGLDAFRALGQDVPPQLQKVAEAVKAQQQALASTGDKTSALSGIFGDLANKAAALAGPAAIGFAIKSSLEYADALTKLSDRTGIGIVALQRLEAIAKPSGNTIDELAGAINKFQKNLAEGDAGAKQAINGLGLAFDEIRRLAPDQQFIEIAKAIQQVRDPAQQTLLAVQLFGKGGAEVLPSLKAKVDELAESTSKMSAESVRALDAFGDALGALKTSTINLVGEIVAQIFKIPASIADSVSRAEEIRRQQQAAPPPPLSVSQGFAITAAAQAGFAFQPPSSAIPTPPLQRTPLTDQLSLLPNQEASATTAIEAATKALAAQQAVADRLGLSLEDYQKKLAEVHAKIQLLTSDTAALSQADAARASQLNAIGLSEDEIALSLGRSSHAVHEYFDGIKAGAQAELDFLKKLDAQNKLEVDAEQATIKLSLAIQEHLLPNTKGLNEAVSGLGAEFIRFDGQNEAVALHLAKNNDNLEKLGTRVFNAKLKVNDFDERITALSKSLTRLAQVSGGAFGEIVNDLASVVNAVDTVKKSLDSISAGGFLNKLSGGIGLVTGAFTAAGLLQGIFDAFSTPEWAKVQDEIARDWGGAISKGTAQAIQDTEKQLEQQQHKLFSQSQFRFPAELINLSSIIKDEGGLNADNLDKFTGRLHDVFSALAQGQLTAAQATKVLDDNFQAFADAGIDKVGLLNAKLVDIIKLNRQVGTESKAIADFIKGQVSDNVFGGLSAFASQNKTPIASQNAASAIGGALAGGVSELQSQGVSIIDILKQVGPIVSSLQKQFDTAGFSGGAAFDLIGREVALANDEIAGPAIGAVNGLGQALRGLSNTGLLTQDVFTGLGDQAAATFNDLIAQGKDGDTALRLMQPTLQTLYELQQQFGFTVDDATQALINQGVQAGIVGEKMKSPQQQQIDALNKVANTLTAIARAMGVELPEAAEDAANGINNAFRKIQTPNIHIPVTYDTPPGFQVPNTDTGYGSTGGYVTPSGIQHFASGGRVLPFLARGTDTVAAMLTPGEVVLTAAQQKHLADRLSGGVGSITVQAEIPVYLDGQQIATNTVTRIIQDKRGAGTALKTYVRGVA